jgi:hypothetical protein
MKYIIKRDTKEHQAVDDAWQLYDKDNYYIVQADSEGWIEYTGTVCPLPGDDMCEVLYADGQLVTFNKSKNVLWGRYVCMKYRPILEQAEPTPAQIEPKESICELFRALDAAHKAAAQIPEIMAKIKTEIEQYGHTVVPLNPFAGAESHCCGNPAQCWEPCGHLGKDEKFVAVAVEPAEDMTDWRNWREGDLLTCIKNGSGITVGHNYELLKIDSQGDPEIKRNNFGETDGYFREHFRFHSRPKGE